MTKTIDGRCGGAKWYKHSQWSSTLFSLSGAACVATNGPLSSSDNTLTQNKCWLSRVSSVSVRVTRLYTFKVCATQYFLMRATLLAVCMWCELNTVRLLGLKVWVGTRHDWLLSEVYQTFIISNLQPTTYFFPQSPVWRIAVPIFPFYFYWQRQKCWSEAKRTVISTQDDGGDQIRAKKLKMHIGLFARLPEKDYISRYKVFVNTRAKST